MVKAMVLGGLRRCEVLGLRLADLQVAARRVFIACGKGGHQRQIPISGRSSPHWRSTCRLNGPPMLPPSRCSWS